MKVKSRRWTFALACGFALALATITPAEPTAIPATAIPVTGDPFTGQLIGASDGKLTFTGGKKPESLNVANLVRWGDFSEPRRGPVWLLVDGGVLVADIIALEKESLQGRSDLFGKLQLPLGAVRGVMLRPPADQAQRDALVDRITSAEGEADVVVLDNGDTINGAIETLSEASLTIAAESGKVEFELARIKAVIFNPALADKPAAPQDPQLVVGFADGSRWIASEIKIDPPSAEIKSPLETLRTRASAITALQTFGGPAVYLSDLTPASYRHVPYLDLSWPLRRDRNVLDRPLRAGKHLYLKGLGLHSAARVTYNLDREFNEFQAELAIDAAAGDRGSVVCSVFVDAGAGKLESKYTSPILRGGQPPVPVRVNLKGVKAISLLVDYADHADVLDHIDWLDARLIK